MDSYLGGGGRAEAAEVVAASKLTSRKGLSSRRGNAESTNMHINRSISDTHALVRMHKYIVITAASDQLFVHTKND